MQTILFYFSTVLTACIAQIDQVNSVDPDQPNPAGRCLIRICTICIWVSRIMSRHVCMQIKEGYYNQYGLLYQEKGWNKNKTARLSKTFIFKANVYIYIYSVASIGQCYYWRGLWLHRKKWSLAKTNFCTYTV